MTTFRPLIPYLAVFAVITALCLLIHLEVQQSLRQGANDPQIQMAEDAAAALAHGTRPFFGTDKIEIAQSLAPFLIVFDKDGIAVATNAVLDGRIPALPHGVFEWVRQHGQDRISWQPRSGVRSALVISPVMGGNGGFVAAGRSLREVEQREAFTFQAAAVVWAVLLVGVYSSMYFYRRFDRARANPQSGMTPSAA